MLNVNVLMRYCYKSFNEIQNMLNIYMLKLFSSHGKIISIEKKYLSSLNNICAIKKYHTLPTVVFLFSHT